MQKSSIKKSLFFVFVGMLTTNICLGSADNPEELLYSGGNNQNKYEFVKEKLYTDPASNGTSILGETIKWIILGSGACVGTAGLISEDKRYLIPIAIGVTPLLYVLNRWLLHTPLCRKEGAANALIDFVKNWPKYKKSTPKEMHEYFDALHAKFQEDPEGYSEEMREFAPKAINKIEFIFREHVKSDYAWWNMENGITAFTHSAAVANVINALNGVILFLNGCVDFWSKVN